MWPIKEKENRHLLIKFPLAVRMGRYGSLIKINPSGSYKENEKSDLCFFVNLKC